MMLENEPMLTADRLRKLLTYNPGTGIFRWKVDRNYRRSEGDIAGHEHSRTKRRLIVIDGHLYQAGRVAWLYMKGTWPNHLINYVNGDPTDIRWSNLRQITFAQRQALRPAKNKLGVRGVWKTRHGKYVAEIRLKREKRYLGQFDTLEEASAAYAKAARTAFKSFARAR
jgi:HNH endonuclease